VQKSAARLDKLVKAGDKDAKTKHGVYQELEAHLSSGKPARTFQPNVLPELLAEVAAALLTAKPTLFVANVSEHDLTKPAEVDGGRPVDKLAAYAREHGAQLVVISGQLEAEIAELPAAERADYLKELGVTQTGLDRLTLAGYKLLDLITFFTVGPKEAHAWTARLGTKAPQCAGKIHTDFEKGFIRAEVIGYQDYVEAGGEVKAKEAGKLRIEGKEYVFQDGDIVHFRFNI
jgi:hypothetical protein